MFQTIIDFVIAYFPWVVLGLFLLFLVWKSFANASANQYITMERRWVGRKMADGRTVALSGEIGLQAKVTGPGLHFFIPFINIARKHKIINNFSPRAN